MFTRHGLNILLTVLTLLGPCTFPEIHALETVKDIYLAPGEQKIIPIKTLLSIAIGNRNIFDVKFPKNSGNMIVIGKQPGLSNLMIFEKEGEKRSYSVKVIESEQKALFLEVKRALSGMEGIEVGILGGKIAIEGEILRPSDKKRILNLVKTNEKMTDLTKLNQKMLSLTVSLMNKRLVKEGFPDVVASNAGEKIFLEGDVKNLKDQDRVLEIAKDIFPDIMHSIEISSAREKMVLVDIKMAEVRENIDRAIGINWQKSISMSGNYSLSKGGGSIGTLTLGEGYSTTLNLLEAKGFVKILASPKLLCRSGVKGSFQSGGELPLRLVGERTAEVMFKDYGLILGVLPKADRSGNIAIEISFEISDLNMATAIEGIPGFVKNSFETAVNIRAGDTVILANLIENRAGKNVEKIPFFGHIPILGELFKSRSFKNQRSEFAVFLTPTLIDSGSETNKKEIHEMNNDLLLMDKKLKPHVLD